MSTGTIAEAARAAPPDAGRIADAHRAILADPELQLDLPHKLPDPPSEAPAWLKALGRAIGSAVEWVGGGWQVLLWLLVALAVGTLLAMLLPSLREWIADRRSRPAAQPVHWTPEAGTARALLDEADALAAAGRFADAVHLLLFRSIEDISAWRGELVRPSYTARDIARAYALPAPAAGVFAGIVAQVERSLFGGDALGRQDWERARADYAGFALGAR